MARCSTMNENQPFRVLKQLGEGGYGTVHLVDHVRYGRVAYKTCPGASIDKVRAQLESEAKQHRNLHHPNVVTLYDTVFNSACCGLFVEYLKYGEVNEFIKRFKVPPEFRIQILYETACGMFYLHGNQPVIIHGDLTCQNILIGDGFHAKIADFGLSRTLKENYESSKTETQLRGKTIYIAPEYFTDPCKRKTEKFDVYGFAISAWEILSQKRAYHSCTNMNLISIYVGNGERPDMSELDMSIPSTIKQMIEKCWHQNDKERPGFKSIKDQLFVHVSIMQSELRRAYVSLTDQEKMRDLSASTDMEPGDMSNTVTNTSEVNRSTNTTMSSKLANMKLENDNDAGSKKNSPVPPGSSTTVDTVHQNHHKVSMKDRAEPAPIKIYRHLELAAWIYILLYSTWIWITSPNGSVTTLMKHTLTFNPRAVAIWNDKLYLVAPDSPDIHVYNADPFEYQRTITVNGMKESFDIVASENVLYVSEWQDKLIHRIQLPEESVSTWTVDGIELKLSIAKNGNVIVASWPDPDKIFEYSSFGSLVREIVVDRFDANLIGLQHAIQMEGDKFLVCHVEATHRRVCMIDNNGRVIKCYGGNPGSGIGQLNLPRYLAIDRNGFILVADQLNNRIVRLNSSLDYIGETVGIQEPVRILLNEERGRLYVIEDDDQSLTVFDV